MLHNKDMLWKAVLEWIWDDLLRFLFLDAVQLFDLEKPAIFLDKELADMHPEPDKKSDVRHVDKLAKVFRKDGTDEWILIHLEIQDATKPKDRALFAERMLRYWYRCFDHHKRPVAAVAIFCGADARLLPKMYMFDFMGTRLQYEYSTICILDYSDEELLKSSNPFAWVMLAAKRALLRGKDADEKLLQGQLFIFRKLYNNGLFERRKLQAVLEFVYNYVCFAEKETMRTFKEEIDKITGKQNTMDIFEVVADMRVEETKWAFVENLIKNTNHSDGEIASLVEVSLDFVKKVKKSLGRKSKKK